METKLARISQMSRGDPKLIFTSIGHLINKEMLKSCHEAMDGTKAKGIDGVSKADYEEHLEENLDKLVDRLKRKAYHPKPARRVEIPKDNGKTRPLSIYCFEDKLVQEALKRILEAVFEPMFYDEMMGFRPNRNCHMALRKLNVMLEKGYTNYVLDADIKGFFDHLDHEWIIRFVESRIKDPNIIRLIRVMLKAGIMKDYVFEETEEGGTRYDHRATIARATSIDGPYELSPHNPLITGFFTPEETLQKAGHASLVQTHTDEWYLAYLVGRPLQDDHKPLLDPRGYCPLGRETAISK